MRLQTIAGLCGIRVEIPARMGAGSRHMTEERIQRADYVVAFPVKARLSNELKLDLNFALQCQKRIILVHDRSVKTRIHVPEHVQHLVLSAEMDYTNSGEIDSVLHQIAGYVAAPLETQVPVSERPPQPTSGLSSNDKGMLAFLGVGLGLLALAFWLDRK